MLQMAGVGSVVMTPLIGNLSDRYGRKTLITLPLTLSVIPYGLYTLLYSFIIQILKINKFYQYFSIRVKL